MDVEAARTAQIDQLETHVQSVLSDRVRDLRLVFRGEGVVLQGHAHTYYAKQLAQHLVMRGTDLPLLANEIQVR
jgi:hypothetical protein